MPEGLDTLWTALSELTVWSLTQAGIVIAAAALMGIWSRRLLHRFEKERARRRHDAAVSAAEARAEEPPAEPEDPAPSRTARALPWLTVALGVVVQLEVLELAPVLESLSWVREGLGIHLIELAGTVLTPAKLLTMGLVVYAGTWVSTFAQAGLASAMARQGVDEGVVASLQRLTHYVILGASGIIALNVGGVNLSAMLASIAVLGVGVGLGLQEVVRNFVSGLVLLIEQSIKPGDILSVEGRLVRVQQMGIRATVCRTLDDDDVVIPNAKLVESTIVNHSLRSDVVRARADVGVSYESDLDMVFKVLREAGHKTPRRMRSRPPVVLLKGFGGSTVDFEVSVWCESAFDRPGLLSALRHRIWNGLKEAGIEIAFAQVDVHFDAPVERAIGAHGGASAEPDEPARRTERTDGPDEA